MTLAWIAATLVAALAQTAPALRRSALSVLAEHPKGTGLPAEELRTIVTADDLWAEEMVERIAARLGFDAELAVAVAP